MDSLDMFIEKYSEMIQLDLPHDVEYEYRQLLNLLVELKITRQKLVEELHKTDNMLLVLEDPVDKAAVEFTNSILNDIVSTLHADS